MMKALMMFLVLSFFVRIGIAQEVHNILASGDIQIIRQYRIEYDLPSDIAVYGGQNFSDAEQIETEPSGRGSRNVLYYCTNTCDEPLFWVVDGFRTRVDRYYLSGVKANEYGESEIDFNFYVYIPAVSK